MLCISNVIDLIYIPIAELLHSNVLRLWIRLPPTSSPKASVPLPPSRIISCQRCRPQSVTTLHSFASADSASQRNNSNNYDNDEEEEDDGKEAKTTPGSDLYWPALPRASRGIKAVLYSNIALPLLDSTTSHFSSFSRL